MKRKRPYPLKVWGIPQPPTVAYLIITLCTKLADKRVRLESHQWHQHNKRTPK